MKQTFLFTGLDVFRSGDVGKVTGMLSERMCKDMSCVESKCVRRMCIKYDMLSLSLTPTSVLLLHPDVMFVFFYTICFVS